jgi:hypothetical protein
MFLVLAVLFFGVAGLLTIFISARWAAIYYIVLGAGVIGGWVYHTNAQSDHALMGWYGHARADSALVGYFMALTTSLVGCLFSRR